MMITYKTIKEDGYRANVAILSCEVTGKPLAEIVIKDDALELVNIIEVISPYRPEASSGKQVIHGDLRISGIEGETQIIELQTEQGEKPDQLVTKVIVEVV